MDAKEELKELNLAYPGGHGVRAGRAVVRVDDDDRDDDGGDDEHHREQHVFPDEGNGTGGGGDQLHDDQQEDSERQQDGDGEGHLFSWGGTEAKTVLIVGMLAIQGFTDNAKNQLVLCTTHRSRWAGRRPVR